MKEEFANERQREADDEKIDIQEVLFKYIIHWPWFVGAVLVCLIGAWIYLRMATPVYNISATVLIKDDKKGGNTGGMAGLEELGFSRDQVYTTLELRMKCGVGKCGRCNIGSKYVCKDGPVFRMDEIDQLPDEY